MQKKDTGKSKLGDQVDRRAFTIPQFCERWNVGKGSVYSEIRAGRLRLTKLGKSSRITDKAEEDWLRLLDDESAKVAAEWRQRMQEVVAHRRDEGTT